MAEGDISTLFVGIDGASASVIEPLIEDGSLPNLTNLLDRGVSAPLEAQVPPTTVSSWTSLCTGVNPGAHGVFGDRTVDRNDASARGAAELTVWELLSFNGKRSVVVNVPGSRSNREFDGALVPGRRDSNGHGWESSPLRRRLEREVGTYRIGPNPQAPPLEEYPRVVRTRGDAFCVLADEYDPSFGLVVFDSPEDVLYRYPKDERLIETVYEAIDEQLGRLIDRYGPSTVLVSSDHGMTQCEFEFRVNEFLRREGFVESTAVRQPTSLGRIERQFPVNGELSLITGVKRLLEKSRIGGRVLGAIPSPGPSGLSVDYERSTAYMRSRDVPGIRVNYRGRNGRGAIPADDYEFVRGELIDALSELWTPTGEPMFEDVARGEEYFWGSNSSESSDVIAVPHELNWSFSTALGGDVFAEPERTWCPTFQGFFALAGESVDTNGDVSGAHIFDIAPTVLASLEVPVSDRMDGDALSGIPATNRMSYPLPN